MTRSLDLFSRRVSCLGQEDCIDGATPAGLDLPRWPYQSASLDQEQRRRLADPIQKRLLSPLDPDIRAAMAALNIELLSFEIDRATLSPHCLGSTEDDLLGEPSELVSCEHFFELSVSAKTPLSDAAMAWLCRQMGERLYPDGAWQALDDEIDFQCHN